MLPGQGFVIVAHFLALLLPGRLLILIIRYPEVRALEGAGHANNILLGGVPVSPQIE